MHAERSAQHALPERLLPYAPYLLTMSLLGLLLGAIGLHGVDYLPLRWALELSLSGQSAYGPAMQASFDQYYVEQLAVASFAYPLPAMWLAVPLLVVPAGAASAVWLALSLGTMVLGIVLLRLPPVLLLYAPITLGLSVQQVTVPLVGLLLIGIWALRSDRRWVLGIVVALTLAAKPQATLLVAGVLAAASLRSGAWRQVGCCGLLLAALTFWLAPEWIGSWLAAVAIYRASLGPVWLVAFVPLAALLLLLGRPWSALAVAQTFLFPTVLGYALLPIMIGYVDRGALATPRATLLVVGCAWIGSLLCVVWPLWIAVGAGFVLPLFLDALIARRARVSLGFR